MQVIQHGIKSHIVVKSALKGYFQTVNEASEKTHVSMNMGVPSLSIQIENITNAINADMRCGALNSVETH